MSSDVKPRGGGIETTKPFVKNIVIQENVGNTVNKKFVRHIIT